MERSILYQTSDGRKMTYHSSEYSTKNSVKRIIKELLSEGNKPVAVQKYLPIRCKCCHHIIDTKVVVDEDWTKELIPKEHV